MGEIVATAATVIGRLYRLRLTKGPSAPTVTTSLKRPPVAFFDCSPHNLQYLLAASSCKSHSRLQDSKWVRDLLIHCSTEILYCFLCQISTQTFSSVLTQNLPAQLHNCLSECLSRPACGRVCAHELLSQSGQRHYCIQAEPSGRSTIFALEAQ